jgi:arabinofuranosyltransferase
MPRPVRAILVLAFLAVLLRTAWIGDDALISLRTVMNVTHGYGLTFNVAERVQTFTHPLWLGLLAGASLVAGNVYYATFALSIGMSLLAFWLAMRGAATPAQAAIAAVALLFSTAFVDYATSGLENPLSNVLLAWFVATGLTPDRDGAPRLTRLWLIGSLLYLTRPDDVLIVAPTLVALTWRVSPRMAAVRPVLVGLLPAAAWTLFAVVYYGFPFPNTAYAKLATGIDRLEVWRQGLLYGLDSIDRDPMTLLTIVLAVGLGLARRGLPRTVAAGLCVYLAYIVSIGGDFMAGRFFAVPLFVSAIVLSRLVRIDPRPAIAVAVLLGAVGLTSARVPLLADSRYERTASKSTGIVDERGVFFRTHSLVHADRTTFAQPEWPDPSPMAYPVHVLETCGLMGGSGLDWGPRTHLMDVCALADPLMARLPAVFNTNWRSGHFRRMVPAGYAQSLETGQNLVEDQALRRFYGDLRTITRSQRLLSSERLAAIWRVNTGGSAAGVDRRFYRHAGHVATLADLARPFENGTAWNAPGVRVLTQPLAVFVDDRPGRRHLDVSLDANDRYALVFVRRNRVIATMELGPIPEHRRSPGLVHYTADIPPSVQRRGFDTMVIAPAQGDDSYSVGHLWLDGEAATDEALRARVAERDRR